MAFKIKPVDPAALPELIAQGPKRGRSSRGGALLEEFIGSGNVAGTVHFGSTKERNAIAISTANAARAAGSQIWIRKQGGGTGTDLLLINLTKADAPTRRAYENRPRPGRKPKR